MKISNIGYLGDFSNYLNKKDTVFIFLFFLDKMKFEELY